MSYLCWLCLSLPPQPTQIRHEPSYKHLEVKTKTTNTNKTCALLQTPRGKDKHRAHVLLCWLCLSLPLGVCRRAHVLFVLVVLFITSRCL
jgi:hypothetical protein